jgi:hypothetical protein
LRSQQLLVVSRERHLDPKRHATLWASIDQLRDVDASRGMEHRVDEEAEHSSVLSTSCHRRPMSSQTSRVAVERTLKSARQVTEVFQQPTEPARQAVSRARRTRQMTSDVSRPRAADEAFDSAIERRREREPASPRSHA